MKKLFFVAALGVAGLMSAQKMKGECGSRGCVYVYASTCNTYHYFTTSKELTLSAALVVANQFNVRECGTRVKELTITS